MPPVTGARQPLRATPVERTAGGGQWVLGPTPSIGTDASSGRTLAKERPKAPPEARQEFRGRKRARRRRQTERDLVRQVGRSAGPISCAREPSTAAHLPPPKTRRSTTKPTQPPRRGRGRPTQPSGSAVPARSELMQHQKI